MFGLINPDQLESAFRRWVSWVLPALEPQEVVAIDGKTSRRSGKVNATALHLVSAFAARAGLVTGPDSDGREIERKDRNKKA